MSRDEIIAVLISDTLERILVLGQVFWLQGILEDGFTGFAQWSDAELRRELCERGLESDEPVDEADDREFDDRLDSKAFLGLSGRSAIDSEIPFHHHYQD